jgi:hypothetical protein
MEIDDIRVIILDVLRDIGIDVSLKTINDIQFQDEINKYTYISSRNIVDTIVE